MFTVLEKLYDIFPVRSLHFRIGIEESGGVVRFDEIPAVFVFRVGKIYGKQFVSGRGDNVCDPFRHCKEFVGDVFDFYAKFPASRRHVATKFVFVLGISYARNRNLPAYVVETEIVHAVNESGDSF